VSSAESRSQAVVRPTACRMSGRKISHVRRQRRPHKHRLTRSESAARGPQTSVFARSTETPNPSRAEHLSSRPFGESSPSPVGFRWVRARVRAKFLGPRSMKQRVPSPPASISPLALCGRGAGGEGAVFETMEELVCLRPRRGLVDTLRIRVPSRSRSSAPASRPPRRISCRVLGILPRKSPRISR
jgi:hypothetical protein